LIPSFSVGEGAIGELEVNVSPGASGNNPGEGVVGKGDEGVIGEVEGKSDLVREDVSVGGLGVGVLLVEPADELGSGQLESPGRHPGAESEEEAVAEESVSHAGLIGGSGELGVEEVSELGEDEVRYGNEGSGENQVGSNPGGLEETKEGADDGVTTVSDVVGSSEGIISTTPEGGLHSNVDCAETSVSTG